MSCLSVLGSVHVVVAVDVLLLTCKKKKERTKQDKMSRKGDVMNVRGRLKNNGGMKG